MLQTKVRRRFVTIREAASASGKSTTTIRRLIRDIVKSASHKHRDEVHPTPKEVEDLQKKGAQYAWTIDEEFLHRAFQEHDETFAGEGPARRSPQRGAGGGPSTVKAGPVPMHEIFQRELEAKERHLEEIMNQLKVKDTQIARQSDIIESLNDRLREGNVLIGSLQQRLAITDGTERTPVAIIDIPPAKKERGAVRTKKKKAGWWKLW